jgi:ADP-heptose:LPS heptosyltransferase
MMAIHRSNIFDAKNIIIFRYGQLGDTLVSVPCLWAIREAFPQACLTLLSEVPGNGHISPDMILPPSGLIDVYWKFETSSSGRSLGRIVDLARQIQSRKFDLLIYLAPPARNGGWRLARDLFFFRLAGQKRIIGHRGGRPIAPKIPGQLLPTVQSEPESLLERLEHGGVPFVWTRLRSDIAPTPEEREKATSWYGENVPWGILESQCVALGVGGKWQSKMWPRAHFVEFGVRLVQELGLFPVVFGGPSDVELGNELLKEWGRGAMAAGRLSVREAAAAMEGMAASAGLKCVGIFSGQDWPGKWRPFGEGHIEIRSRVECEGCKLQRCDKGTKCLATIKSDEVFRACKSLL